MENIPFLDSLPKRIDFGILGYIRKNLFFWVFFEKNTSLEPLWQKILIVADILFNPFSPDFLRRFNIKKIYKLSKLDYSPMDYRQFFDALNENIRKSTTERSLKNLERIGENYVKNILKNRDISILVKNEVKREIRASKKLIQKQRKKLD